MRGLFQAIFCLLVLSGFRGSSAQRFPFRGRPGRNCNRPCPSNYDPVCGTDGQTYDNRCILNYARNCFNRRVRVRHRSTCDCSGQCPTDYVPVCGTDRQTYTNRCVLEHARRCQNQRVRLQHSGECDTTSTTNPNCRQSVGCPFNYDPVCGSDGQTYSNLCVFQNAACTIPDLRKVNDGECASTTNPNCRQSVACPLNYAPVCGSDGQTYGNLCAFENAACTIPNLRKVNDGECGSTTSQNCDQFRVCTLDYSPVCGSDGRTYSNECLLDVERCSNPNLSKVHDGQCGSTTNPVCNQLVACPANYAPVCGSDGRTYGNQCNLDFARCSNPSLRKLHDGECGSTPNQQCNQATACPANYAPVCGSDGRTYGNQCALDVARCRDQNLSKVYDGECSSFPIFLPFYRPIG